MTLILLQYYQTVTGNPLAIGIAVILLHWTDVLQVYTIDTTFG